MKTPIAFVVTGLIASLAAATVVAPLLAQTAPSAPGQGRAHGGGKLQKLAEYLGLTDAQKEQLRPILKSEHEQAKAIKADTTLTPEQKKDKLKELHRSSRQQMLAVLTPEQREKLKALKQHKNPNGANA